MQYIQGEELAVKNGWKEEHCQRVRSVGVGEVHYKRVECKLARVAQGSYRAENEISGGATTKWRSC